jgi:hypothetical protein
MKQKSRPDLEADVRLLSQQNTALARALNAVLNHRTDFPVSFFVKAAVPGELGRYTFRFFDPESPAGERVIATYHYPGQDDYSVVYDVDEQREYANRNPSSIWGRVFYYALSNRKRRVA